MHVHLVPLQMRTVSPPAVPTIMAAVSLFALRNYGMTEPEFNLLLGPLTAHYCSLLQHIATRISFIGNADASPQMRNSKERLT